MKRYVLDCSVSVAWFLQDESSGLADRCLDLLVKGEAVVPSLWVVEMANALLVAERRRRIKPDDVSEAMNLLASLPISVHTESRDLMPRMYAVAGKHGLSAYDACYLDLALQLKLPLASLDERQRKAASGAGVRLM